MMGLAHSIRMATKNRYDIVDVLEMEPLRRRMLVASIIVAAEDEENKPKTPKKPKKGGVN